MKPIKIYWLTFFAMLLFGAELHAQYGYGYGQRGNSYGRQRPNIPQADTTPEPPKPKTADEIVDGEMPSIIETLELNEFEAAVLSSILKKYVQQRIEMQILKLPREKMLEGFDKITEAQDAELRAGLPLEKYEAFVEMQKNGIQKTKKEKKRENKRKKKKSKD